MARVNSPVTGRKDTYTYAQLLDLVARFGGVLRDLGVTKGDRVVIYMPMVPEAVVAMLACARIGAVHSVVFGGFAPAELAARLEDAAPKVVVSASCGIEPSRVVPYKPMLDEAIERSAHKPDHCVILQREQLTADMGERDLDWKQVMHPDAVAPAEVVPVEATHPLYILYTSGTTGKPKGAISTHRSMIANLQNTLFSTLSGAMANPDAGSPLADSGPNVSLLTSPLFHVSGCHSGLVVGMLAGIKIVIPAGRFDPAHALELIQDHGVTVWATVPTMVWRVCEHPGRHDYDTSSVKTVAFGGSPSADELQRKVADTFPNVRSTSNAYGLTETSSVATVISGPDAKRKPDSVGPPVPTVEVRIVDPLNQPLPTGETGEVCIRGPILMKGYWNKPEATAEAIDAEGWLHSGDIGHLDDEGYLTITDRKKDMIIRGGENIYCVEIENRLVENPAIADAAIIGVPHPELGEEVKAVVQLESGHSLSEDDVRAWVRAELADFKVPAYVEVRTDPLPRNASGKLLKNVLRGEGEVSFVETM